MENKDLQQVQTVPVSSEATEALVSIQEQLEVTNAHLSYLVNMNFLFLVCLGAYMICAIWYKVVKSFI